MSLQQTRMPGLFGADKHMRVGCCCCCCSLDNDSMGKQRALDDVFTLDL